MREREMGGDAGRDKVVEAKLSKLTPEFITFLISAPTTRR
jgi:hypothetical protein